MESLESAEKRGAKIYCEIKSYHTNCNAKHPLSPEENGNDTYYTLSRSLIEAGITHRVSQSAQAPSVRALAREAAVELGSVSARLVPAFLSIPQRSVQRRHVSPWGVVKSM